ncbi:MAG: formylglycine-generating enzyme family protein, partial [Aliidongia sp.]
MHLVACDSTIADFVDTAVRAADIFDETRHSPCRAVILLLDCCHAGAIGQEMNVGNRGEAVALEDDQLRRAVAAAEGLFILASSSPWQSSQEAEDEPGGQVMGRFTRAIVECLEAEQGGEAVLFSDLARHVTHAFDGQDTREFRADAQGDPLIARLRPQMTPKQRRTEIVTRWFDDGEVSAAVFAVAMKAIRGEGPAILVKQVSELLDALDTTSSVFGHFVGRKIQGATPPRSPIVPLMRKSVSPSPAASPVEPPSFWKSGKPPGFVEASGRDKFGLWMEFSVPNSGGAAVTQRMRWLPPGRFLMGSPADEPERLDNEGPQHEVTISQGFWLGDTACTQALWQAVMGTNPSQFTGDDRHPVEPVSWDDVQEFLQRIAALRPGLALSLPSEAEWEYACRAGTTTPFSFGTGITPAQVNYNGNSPYPGGKQGRCREETVPVGSLPANPWGLYEMHGNVWEWCADGRRNYDTAPQTDPRGPEGETSVRALRGGCWSGRAGGARSACRLA